MAINKAILELYIYMDAGLGVLSGNVSSRINVVEMKYLRIILRVSRRETITNDRI